MSSNVDLLLHNFSIRCLIYRDNLNLLNQYGLKSLHMPISIFPLSLVQATAGMCYSCLNSYVCCRLNNPFCSFLDCKMNLCPLHTWRCYTTKLLNITELADLLIFLVACIWIPGCLEGTAIGGQSNCFWINMLRKFRVVMPAAKVKLQRTVIYWLIYLKLVRGYLVLIFAFENGYFYFEVHCLAVDYPG